VERHPIARWCVHGSFLESRVWKKDHRTGSVEKTRGGLSGLRARGRNLELSSELSGLNPKRPVLNLKKKRG